MASGGHSDGNLGDLEAKGGEIDEQFGVEVAEYFSAGGPHCSVG